MFYFKKSKRYTYNLAALIILLLLFGFESSGQGWNKVDDFQDFSTEAFFPYSFTQTSAVVSASSDDAEEDSVTGSVSLNSTDLELVNDDVDQVVGMRFNGLNIPQCATINSAYIQFTTKGDTGNDGPCNLTIYGEDSDNALTFSTNTFDISNRPKTTASAFWVPQPWFLDGESGILQRTVDISPLIQEIVERVAFTSSSSIAIIIEGTGLRRVYSFDGNVLAPIIFIDYNPIIPDNDNDGVCDANDQCPGGPEPGTPCDDLDATTYNDAIDSNCNCVGIDYDCPSIPANIGDPCDDGNPNTSNDLINSNCVCAGSYDCPSLQLNIGDTCDDGNPNTSNDLVNSFCVCEGSYDCPSLQLNVGDACNDGISGTYNDIVLSNCECMGTWECPTLMLGYGDLCDDGNPNTSSDMVDSTCTCVGLPFVCISVSASSDDSEETASGIADISSSDLELVLDVTTQQTVGVRFNNLNIPQCAVITSATIQFTAKGSSNGPCTLNIYGEASDNALTFSNNDFDVTNRSKTNATVIWNPLDWENDGDATAAQQTVDISPLIQEIVERVGFTPNSSIAIIIEGTGTRRAYSYDGIPSSAPEICIEYIPMGPDADGDGVCDANDLCPGGPEPGTLCDDGDPETLNDYIDSNCECIGGFDCPSLSGNVGDPCDDGIPGTYNDTISMDCECLGIWECDSLMVGFGYLCDDGDPNTLYDMIDSTCNCVGTPFISVKIIESSDDAEELPSGSVDVSSSDLEMVVDADSTQIVGLRFNDLNIPQCAVINYAHIQFTSKGTTNLACDLEIYGEASDSASTFINNDFDISDRPKTNTFVSWSPEDWLSDGDTLAAQQTVDISSIIQEIVDREGFMESSSIAFIIEGTGTRRAYSYDGIPLAAPRLYIEYLPMGPDDDGDGVCNANDWCANGPEPGTACDDGIMETYDDAIDSTCMCVGIPFDCDVLLANFGDPCDDGDPNTPNDFIDSNCECVGGFDCPIIMANFGDPCDDGFSGTFNDTINIDCKCMGTWECPDIMAGFGDPCDDGDSTTLDDMIDLNCDCIGSPTVYSQIAESSDDAEEKETGQVLLTSSDLELVYDGNIQIVGLRFTNLNIPNGARIDTAFIQFTTDEVIVPNVCDLKIYGEDTDDAQTFIDVNSDVSGRPKTSAMVNWSPEEWLVDGEADSIQQTGNLKPIIKEIVNRNGFTSNSSIAFIIEGTGTRTATAYDGDPEKAPELYIRYDLPLATRAVPNSRTEKLLVYPVPATDNLTVSFTCNVADDIPVQILDINGRLLFSEKRSVQAGKNDILIEQLNLRNGIYFIQLYFDNTVHTAKFTIMR